MSKEKKQDRNLAFKAEGMDKAKEAAFQKKLQTSYYLPTAELSISGKDFKAKIIDPLSAVIRNTIAVGDNGQNVVTQLGVLSVYQGLIADQQEKALLSGAAFVLEEHKEKENGFLFAQYKEESVIPFSGAQFWVLKSQIEEILSENTSTVINNKGEVIGSTLLSKVEPITRVYRFLLFDWHSKNVEAGKTVPIEEYKAYFENMKKSLEPEVESPVIVEAV